MGRTNEELEFKTFSNLPATGSISTLYITTDTDTIYYWNGSAYVSLSGGGSGGDTLPVVDTKAIVKGSVDNTKQVRIEADGIATGNTRVITMPDEDVNLGDIADKLNLTGGSLSGVLNEAKGINIASAATTDIGAATGNSVNITGTTAITGLGTIQAGAKRTLTFDGILTLTYNATSLILPTSANITTAAGDTADFISLGSGNWICTNYQRKSGEALVGGSSGGGASDLFQAYLLSNLNLTTALTTIIYPNENYDTGSNYNTSTGIYTVPSDGKYYFHARVRVGTGVIDGDVITAALKVTASFKIIEEFIYSKGSPTFDFSKVLDLTAGQTIFIQIRNDTGARGSIAGGDSATYFEGYKLI